MSIKVTMEDGQVFDNVDPGLLKKLVATGKVTDVSGKEESSYPSTSSSSQGTEPLPVSPSPSIAPLSHIYGVDDPNAPKLNQGTNPGFVPGTVNTASSMGPASASAAPSTTTDYKPLSLNDTYGAITQNSTLAPGKVEPFVSNYPATSRFVAENLNNGRSPYSLGGSLEQYLPGILDLGSSLVYDAVTDLARQGAEIATDGKIQAGMRQEEVSKAGYPLTSVLFDPSTYVPVGGPEKAAVKTVAKELAQTQAPKFLEKVLAYAKQGAKAGTAQGTAASLMQASDGDNEKALTTLAVSPLAGAIIGTIAQGGLEKAASMLKKSFGFTDDMVSYILDRVPMLGSTVEEVKIGLGALRGEAIKNIDQKLQYPNPTTGYPDYFDRVLQYSLDNIRDTRLKNDLSEKEAAELVAKANEAASDLRSLWDEKLAKRGETFSSDGYSYDKNNPNIISNSSGYDLDFGSPMDPQDIAKMLNRYRNYPQIINALETVLFARDKAYSAANQYVTATAAKAAPEASSAFAPFGVDVGKIIGKIQNAATPENVRRAGNAAYGTIPGTRFPITALGDYLTDDQ